MALRRNWSRREVMRAGVLAGVGVAGKFVGAQQMPAPEPLEDAGVRLVTTTETSAWQKGLLF